MITTEVNTIRRDGKVVLVIDDQVENLALIEAIVTSAGYEFYGAANAMEGLSLAGRVAPRVILMDVQMPQMDGFEACRRLRTLAGVRDVPIAFLTARRAPADVRAGIAAGGNDFIVKPVDPQRLLARLDHWSSRRVG